MNRVSILEHASDIITNDRAQTHGEDAENSFGVIAAYWSAHLDCDVSASDVAVMMTLLKLARIKGNPTHLDSWVDACGYAAIGGELESGE